MSATQILARIEMLLLQKVYSDTSIIFSVQHGGVFWVRTVTKDMRHIDGEVHSLIEAFQDLLADSDPNPPRQSNE